MKMDSRNTVRTIASLLLLILLSCELSFVEATSPLSQEQDPELFDPSSVSIEFPQCSELSGFRYFQCITQALIEFNQYYITDAVQCFKAKVGTPVPSREYDK